MKQAIKDILSSNHRHWKDFDIFSDFAKEVGYTHVLWNGRIYEAGNFESSSTLKDLNLDSSAPEASLLRSVHKGWHDFDEFYDVFLKSGYPEYLWNGIRYNADGVVGTTPGMGF